MDIEDSRSTTNHYPNLIDTIEKTLNFINHLFICFIAIYMTYFCFKTGFVNTSVHAWFLTIGYQLLMAEGILCLYSNNIWSSSIFIYKRETKVTIHWILLLIGSLSALFGTAHKMYIKGIRIYSIHAYTGLISIILIFFNLTSGLTALYSTSLRTYITPILNKTFHAFLGLAGYTVGMVSFYYGYNTGFIQRKIEPDFIALLKVLVIITIVLTILSPIRTVIRNCRIMIKN